MPDHLLRVLQVLAHFNFTNMRSLVAQTKPVSVKWQRENESTGTREIDDLRNFVLKERI